MKPVLYSALVIAALLTLLAWLGPIPDDAQDHRDMAPTEVTP